jgi:hypothetical protein
MIGLAQMVGVVSGGIRIDAHAANRIKDEIGLHFLARMRFLVTARMWVRMSVAVRFGHRQPPAALT